VVLDGKPLWLQHISKEDVPQLFDVTTFEFAQSRLAEQLLPLLPEVEFKREDGLGVAEEDEEGRSH
jgi:hypothetical protein